MRVDVDENDFHRAGIGLPGGDHLVQPGEQHAQPLRQAALAALDHAARHVGKLLTGLLDHAEAGEAQTGVDPKDAAQDHNSTHVAPAANAS